MTENAADFKARLIRRAGLSEAAVDAAWPEWWSDAAEASPSANAELRFTLARKLGLDPRSLMGKGQPKFIWDDSARFKGFSGDPSGERPILSSFGMALCRMLLGAVPDAIPVEPISALRLRKSILSGRQDIGLLELLSTAWAMGIPVIHLRVYPLTAKRMSAMSVRLGERFAILVARDAMYPAPVAFHVAHELGHIFLGHLQDGHSIVDLESIDELSSGADPEEQAADAYALELLTGRPSPEVVVEGPGAGARQLANEAIRVGQIEHIEPGTLAMVYGHATKAWPTAMASLRHIYGQPMDAWRVINQVALRQLDLSQLNDESEAFVRAVMGATHG
ncbi:ImmA/IrrE family metallo-endopeptidase [Dyella sedimenti]|uniref:ImmA/IrrE family metallo-endopeptidase n=1 Tax=Dyella sedimenti TaxID=2919947 RepID=UPI001FAA1FE8|nr:hypothetical protein [Dyella sedimenti]